MSKTDKGLSMPLARGRNVEKLEQKRDVRGLIRLLERSDQPMIRSRAANALGRVGDQDSISVLEGAVWDPDRMVSDRAVKALRALEADDALVRVLSRNDPPWKADREYEGADPESPSNRLFGVRRDALKGLSEMGAADALAQLLDHPNDLVRGDVHRALAVLGDRRAVDPLIRDLAESKSARIRAEAARALGDLGDPRAVPPLIAALGDTEIYQGLMLRRPEDSIDVRNEQPTSGLRRVADAAASALLAIGGEQAKEAADTYMRSRPKDPHPEHDA